MLRVQCKGKRKNQAINTLIQCDPRYGEEMAPGWPLGLRFGVTFLLITVLQGIFSHII